MNTPMMTPSTKPIMFARSIRKGYVYTELDVDTNMSEPPLNHIRKEMGTNPLTFVTPTQENTQSAHLLLLAIAHEVASVHTCMETSATPVGRSVCILSDLKSEKSTQKNARRSKSI